MTPGVRFAAVPAPYHLDQGLDLRFWLALDAPEQFATLAIERAGQCPAAAYVSVTEMNGHPTASLASFRPRTAIRVFDHRLAAHALVARMVENVEMTLRPVPAYELEQLPLDLLAAPGAGVDRSTLHDWLVDRKRMYDRARPPGTIRERWLRRLAWDFRSKRRPATW